MRRASGINIRPQIIYFVYQWYLQYIRTDEILLFADDTNILCKHDNYLSLCDMLNMELIKLSKWLSVNKLSLNIRKSSYMLFGNKHVNDDIQICIDREELDINMSMMIYKFVLIGKN